MSLTKEYQRQHAAEHNRRHTTRRPNQSALIVLATSMALSCVIALTPADAQIVYDGPIIDRLNKWELG